MGHKNILHHLYDITHMAKMKQPLEWFQLKMSGPLRNSSKMVDPQLFLA